MNEEEEGKKNSFRRGGDRHDRATFGTGRAKILEYEGWVLQGQAWPCAHRHGLCQVSGILGSILFFRFLESCLDNYLQNNLKQHKTNKIKAIKLMGCLPRSALLKSLA